jgi:hypothetical protein
MLILIWYTKAYEQMMLSSLHSDSRRRLVSQAPAVLQLLNGQQQPAEPASPCFCHRTLPVVHKPHTAPPAGLLATDEGDDRAALRRLFLRVDANCDGTVDWDEFSNHMLLEGQAELSLR